MSTEYRPSDATTMMEILPHSTLVTDDLHVTSEVMNGSVVRATTDVTTHSQLMAFCRWYQAIHGYVCIVVCSFGIVANIMNIIVLTRRNMVC